MWLELCVLTAALRCASGTTRQCCTLPPWGAKRNHACRLALPPRPQLLPAPPGQRCVGLQPGVGPRVLKGAGCVLCSTAPRWACPALEHHLHHLACATCPQPALGAATRACPQDLVHWHHVDHAIEPTLGSVDNDGCFSGCAAIDTDGIPCLLYTGVGGWWPHIPVLLGTQIRIVRTIIIGAPSNTRPHQMRSLIVRAALSAQQRSRPLLPALQLGPTECELSLPSNHPPSMSVHAHAPAPMHAPAPRHTPLLRRCASGAAPLHLCTYAPMHLCVYAPMHAPAPMHQCCSYAA